MPTSGTLEVSVITEGNRMVEFDTQVEINAQGQRIVACWIPSEAGKEFTLIVKDLRDFDRPATQWSIAIDGMTVDNRILFPGIGPYASHKNEAIFSDVATVTGRNHLSFNNISLTDDDDLLEANGNPALGEVAISVYRIELLGRQAVQANPVPIVFGSGVLHERSKKAGVHHIQHGSASYSRPPMDWTTRLIGPPLVKFIFRYRPLAILQATGIAPPSAQTSGGSTNRSRTLRGLSPTIVIKDDSIELDDAPEDKIRELEERLSRLKRKRNNNGGPSIKTEADEPIPKRPRVLGQSVEVIDLTLDDD